MPGVLGQIMRQDKVISHGWFNAAGEMRNLRIVAYVGLLVEGAHVLGRGITVEEQSQALGAEMPVRLMV